MLFITNDCHPRGNKQLTPKRLSKCINAINK